MSTKHLWEVEHSYYCNDEPWREYGGPTQFDSWSHFINKYRCADEDINFLFRWDWVVEKDHESNEPTGRHILKLYFMQQRLGRYAPCEVMVELADEPSIREYLATKWQYMQRLWEPMLEHATTQK